MDVNTDYSQRYRELHVVHTALMQDRYRDQRIDDTRQILAREHEHRIERARQLDRDLGQNVDLWA